MMLSFMIAFINETLKSSFLEEKILALTVQGNIISAQVSADQSFINSVNTKQYLKKFIDQQSLDIKSRIFVLDKASNVLIDSEEEMEGQSLQMKEISDALGGEKSHGVYELDSGQRVMYVSVPMLRYKNVEGAVLISSSAESIYTRTSNIIGHILLLSVIGIIITGIISFLFADIISSPIERITELVNKITRGNFDVKLEVDGNDELTKLSNAINSMAVKLDEIDDQRKSFVSNVSHELRTPLASMKILSGSLLQMDKLDEEITRDFLQDIDGEVDRLSKIIDSLLYLVDIEKKDMVLEYTDEDVNSLIRSIVRQLSPLASQKDIALVLEDSPRIVLPMDKGKMSQCLINIIGNAIKFTPNNGSVTISVWRDKDRAGISVRDTGIGIPEKDLENIFDRFYRVDSSRARNTGGTGLGLSIAKQIVNLHQGEIGVESAINSGTTVRIYLPLSR